ncbi:flagellar biosynthetic protein FliO [Gallaecimonas sp. GXIMD4217]|uniref:flagellar biosynthetic protein FliO n=1 Tax=Gallaecimonas sp. GXIMD4217 TaxID=3131927 RepID=UPI00311AD4B8
MTSLLASAVASGGPELGASLWQLLLSLALVIAVVVALGYLVRRFQPGMLGGPLKVVAQLPLGARQRLLVVQAGKQQLLLGVSQNEIRLIKELDEPLETQNDKTPR